MNLHLPPIRIHQTTVQDHTFVASVTAIGKAWFRKGKHCYRSPFDGKVREVPYGLRVIEWNDDNPILVPCNDEERRIVAQNDPWIRLLRQEEDEKRRQQKQGWWCDWVPKKNRFQRISGNSGGGEGTKA